MLCAGLNKGAETLGSAYTPGLTVSADIVVRRVRRLPIKGEVLVLLGETVTPDQVIAQAQLPGILQTVKLADKLGIEAKDVAGFFQLKAGDAIAKDQVIAETKGFFGMFKSTVTSEFSGVVEAISEVTGSVLVREPSLPVDMKAYVRGIIAEVMPEEGVIVETRCSMVQGIFGVGGERTGIIRVATAEPDEILGERHILDTDAGNILVGGAGVTFEALQRASTVGVKGIVVGGVKDSDLIQFLGYDIGVAITGQEAINLTLMVTEGFGFLAMAHRTFELLKSLQGKEASINGATQIRAGVIRPEILVPHAGDSPVQAVDDSAFELRAGANIRMIREPYFGKLGTVTELPAQLVTLESGTEVRVLRAKLSDGSEITVPRANVEIVAGSK